MTFVVARPESKGNRDELLGYGLSEEIVYFKRRWFVLLDDALRILSGLLAHRKPVRDTTVTDQNTGPNARE
jgi:hypothetical protein